MREKQGWKRFEANHEARIIRSNERCNSFLNLALAILPADEASQRVS